MTAPVTTPEAQRYLAAVAAHLSDLPLEERTDLLEDLAQHLTALAEEPEDERPFEVRIGTPGAYAAELRAAAGLPPRGAKAVRATPELVLAVHRTWRRAAATRAGREVLAFLPLLEPAWWVLRAYLLLVAVALLTGSGTRDALLLDVGFFGIGELVVLGAAVVGSVALARRPMTTRHREVLRAGEVVLGVFTVWAVLASGGTTDYAYVDSGAPSVASEPYPLLSTSGPVTDIFPYSADGTPLDGVLLYDQDGRPLRTGDQEWWADDCHRRVQHPVAADGIAVEFSYPRDYVLDGTTAFSDTPAPGQCAVERPRPDVPLPVFPSAAPAPAAPVAPAPAVPAPPAS
jgi:hypothetical protein